MNVPKLYLQKNYLPMSTRLRKNQIFNKWNVYLLHSHVKLYKYNTCNICFQYETRFILEFSYVENWIELKQKFLCVNILKFKLANFEYLHLKFSNEIFEIIVNSSKIFIIFLNLWYVLKTLEISWNHRNFFLNLLNISTHHFTKKVPFIFFEIFLSADGTFIRRKYWKSPTYFFLFKAGLRRIKVPETYPLIFLAEDFCRTKVPEKFI